MSRNTHQSGWAMAALTAGAMALCGCHHQQQVSYQPPPPSAYGSENANSSQTGLRAERKDAPRGFFDDTRGKPVFTQTGLASWYGTKYQHHAAADGSVFKDDEMTAAHRTLPLGSTVRVTNLATGQQVLVRITDRGPFSPGRVIDLSEGAAKVIGVYRAGIAKVKVEAFAHSSTDPSGKWCVQTGAFKTEGQAMDLKKSLLHRFHDARVVEFEGPTGYWVRIDPLQHDKTEANHIAEWIGTPGPAALPYVVRVD